MTLLFSLFQFLLFTSPVFAWSQCKASPGSPDWPSLSQWASLNTSLCGALLAPPPPGAGCHPDQPEFATTNCTALEEEWLTIQFHQANPISNAWNNFNNDSCLPYPADPCSGAGYPVYVVNATSKEDVKKGVDFARENNVRLVVKATGHDYIGRSVAPNSLSIWTHHLTGISWHNASFTPQNCPYSIETPAATIAAGTQFSQINAEAAAHGLYVLSAGGGTVAIGGYITAGGHAALSAYYGLAADNALEFEIVTPSGEILVINECQNRDLFWAVRGGGGSTFGVVTSVTVKAFPSVPLNFVEVEFATQAGNPHYWDALLYALGRYPELHDAGLAGYSFFGPNISDPSSGINELAVYQGIFILPQFTENDTLASLNALLEITGTYINTTWPGEFILEEPVNYTFPNYDDFYVYGSGPNNAGTEQLVGSRLLPREVFEGNKTALRIALQESIPPRALGDAYLVTPPEGIVPRGGSNAVNPAWRKALVHYTNGVSWPNLDYEAGLEQRDLLTNTYVEALRVLAPDSGAYQNEADKYEPNFQQAFWGDNYPRLLDIKRRFDPQDVFWCNPCVGNERWEEVGDQLCRVEAW